MMTSSTQLAVTRAACGDLDLVDAVQIGDVAAFERDRHLPVGFTQNNSTAKGDFVG